MLSIHYSVALFLSKHVKAKNKGEQMLYVSVCCAHIRVHWMCGKQCNLGMLADV